MTLNAAVAGPSSGSVTVDHELHYVLDDHVLLLMAFDDAFVHTLLFGPLCLTK